MKLRHRIIAFLHQRLYRLLVWLRYARDRALGRSNAMRVVYFPEFTASEDLTNHLYRAYWYLQPAGRPFKHIDFFTAADARAGERPAPMGAARRAVEHVVVHPHPKTDHALQSADIVLSWRDFDTAKQTHPDKRVLNIATDDPDSIEYGQYCGISWRALPEVERILMLRQSHRNFKRAAKHIAKRSPRSAVVFGTGPSIEKAFQYDFSGQLTVVCNSTVQNRELLEHIQPDFICAGDAISHFGVSRYAERFREDLASVLESTDCWFLTTAPFGWLFATHYPSVAHRVLLCEQKSTEPVFDLRRTWSLPQLDSTLNIHMLPLAATFCRRIYLLGCDGKSPDPKQNEDFWSHAHGAQYHDLVETGHQCHPTFAARREKSTHARFIASVEQTFTDGETRHAKSYHSLAPSFTEPINDRVFDGPAAGPTGLIDLP